MPVQNDIFRESYTMSYNSYERLYLVKCGFGKKFETKYHVVVVERKTFFPLNRSIAPPHGWINLIFLLNIYDVMPDSDMTSFFMTHRLWVIKTRFFHFFMFLTTYFIFMSHISRGWLINDNYWSILMSHTLLLITYESY